MRRLPEVLAALALGLAALACSLFPAATRQPAETSAHAVETAVQATVQALQAAPGTIPGPASPAAPTPGTSSAPAATQTQPPVSGILPSALYFLAPDTQGRQQVWRLAPDAANFYPVTAETSDVTDYDISRTGVLAYVAQNQLLLRTVNAGGRQVLADGGPDDGSDAFRFTKKIEAPAWSPDGKTLAYGLNGLHLVQVEGGSGSGDSLILPNSIEDRSGLLIPQTLYQPGPWSPDGTRLLLSIGFYEGATKAIYVPGSKAVIQLTKGDQGNASCCTVSWAPDGQSVYSAGFIYGGSSSDLWRYDAATGKGTQLIPEIAPDGTYNYTDWPLLGSSGKLYTFFANQASVPSADVLLQMTSSDPDGVTGRAILRNDPVHLSEALWAPDGSLAVGVLPAPGDVSYPAHGQIAILFAGPQPLTQVVTDGRLIRWGP